MQPKIIRTQPWFFPFLKLFFPSADFDKTVVVFGKKIYSKDALSLPLYAHEYTHCEQQGFSALGAIKWWIKYIVNWKFRVVVELDAYRTQYEVFKTGNKDRNERSRFLDRLASDLSGPLYKNCIEFERARELIEKSDKR